MLSQERGARLPSSAPVAASAVHSRLHHPRRGASKCKFYVAPAVLPLADQALVSLLVLGDDRLFPLQLRLLNLLPPLLHLHPPVHVLHPQRLYVTSPLKVLLLSELLSL